MLYYSAIWIGFLGVIVVFHWYEKFSPNDYLLVGWGLALPCWIGPLLLPSNEEKKLPVLSRYIIKANIFIFIVGYIGNHFYTHYFYSVLEMKYTGPLSPGEGLEINRVPVSMFLFTHPYFMTYHVLVTPIIRAAKSYLHQFQFHYIFFAIFVAGLAFGTAFVETWTISGFPYYTYPDLSTMLTKGSTFYGVFFVVTYPWFYRLDEDPHFPWSIGKVITEALAAMMVVLLSADFLRLTVM